MASVVTGLVGGFMGSGAAKKAAGQLGQGYIDAGKLMGDTTGQARDIYQNAGEKAGTGVMSTANAGATNLASVASAGANDVRTAGVNAGAGVTQAATGANALLDPYIDMGKVGATGLTTGMQAGGDLMIPTSADEIMKNNPGYQFQLSEGLKAQERAQAAAGLTGSGAAAKALTTYAQNSAKLGYQQAFDDTLRQQAQRFGQLSGMAGQGQQAATQAGANTENAAIYSGNTGIATDEFGAGMNTDAARINAANLDHAAEYQGNATMWGQGNDASTLMGGTKYSADALVGKGEADASGTMGSAKAWSSALGQIGGGIDSALTGGFGGGGGFSWSGALSGIPKSAAPTSGWV